MPLFTNNKITTLTGQIQARFKTTAESLVKPAPPNIPLNCPLAKESSGWYVNKVPYVASPNIPIKHCKFQILLVEDSLVNKRVYSELLEKCGCTFYITNSGIEDLDILPNATFWRERSRDDQFINFSVILMDIPMLLMVSHARHRFESCSMKVILY